MMVDDEFKKNKSKYTVNIRPNEIIITPQT